MDVGLVGAIGGGKDGVADVLGDLSHDLLDGDDLHVRGERVEVGLAEGDVHLLGVEWVLDDVLRDRPGRGRQLLGR
eukprot:4167298-Alexandrium_andersonii.AAC.1